MVIWAVLSMGEGGREELIVKGVCFANHFARSWGMDFDGLCFEYFGVRDYSYGVTMAI